MMKEKKIDFSKIEKKWQEKWEKKKIFEVKEKKGKKKFYVLDMFPYPSAAGLHIGHAFVFSLGDIFARFKRLQGYNVLYPIGYDSLGLPAENAAIKEGTPPKDYTENSIKNFMKQQKAMGWSYDWSRMIKSHDPSYYKWDQWIFLKMFEKGIAYRKKAPVNWCPKCETVLANEQVINGCCWRHEDTNVEIKHLEQWFFRITDYAEELLKGLEKVNWPENAKKLQKNWVGKSYGTEIEFEIENPDKKLNCIIVHGCPSNKEKAMNPKTRTYDKHWIPWIKKELGKREINTEAPLMPEPWKANYSNWKKEFEKSEVNENTILIGHSCGCAFLVRWLGETKKKIKKLILVAPWKIAKSGNAPEKFYDYTIDNAIRERIKEIIIFTSNNEETDGKRSVKIFQDALNGELIELKDKGHYTLVDMGTEEFPELLDKIFNGKKWPIFTTRPDTIYGVTFMVISAQHPNLMDLVTKEQKKDVENFLKRLKSVSEKELEDMGKEGVFTGSYAVNPLTNEKMPVYAGNFVLADYGSGMVMAVPAHDQRDFEFAKKYKIPIKVVIQNKDKSLNEKTMRNAYTEEGILVNSGEFNGMESSKAIEEISKYLESRKLGKKTVNYKLRDWLISRQRYWGTPIPIIYCEKCGIVLVPEKDLPVKLPEKVKFGKGNPLATSESWIKVKCPKCKGNGRRETDTMDTFVNSSWYYLRYCDPKNNKKIFDEKKTGYWCPIDQYIGGPEHITMHLIYIRFYTKFLRDFGLLKFDEPALRYFTQGIVHGSDGEKMSKSRGNIVEPFDMIHKYGADTLRLALVSFASPDKDTNWDEKVVSGSHKLLNKVYDYFSGLKLNSKKADLRIDSKINKTIKEVTEDIENFKHNLAIIKIRILFDYFSDKQINKETAEKFLKILHVYCPFITEELWEKIGGKGFISLAEWPKADEKKINEKFEEQDKVMEKLREDINNIIKIIEGRGEKKEKIYVYCLPSEKELYNEEIISRKIGKQVKIFAVNDKNKHDPTNKSKNSKPGKPAIYIE